MPKKKFYLLEAPEKPMGTPWELREGKVIATVIYAESEHAARQIATEGGGYLDVNFHHEGVRVTVLDETYQGEEIVIEDTYCSAHYGL